MPEKYSVLKGKTVGTTSVSATKANTNNTINPKGVNPAYKIGVKPVGPKKDDFEEEIKKRAPYKVQDYKINADSITLDVNKSMSDALRNLFGIEVGSNYAAIAKKQRLQYNRFKIPVIDDALQRGFGHVFFVRPDCNLLDNASTNKLPKLLKDNPSMTYAIKNNPSLVLELVESNGSDGKNDDFMMYISNKANSFSLTDEYITKDTYGKTYAGYKIAYGKHNVESKSAGDFQVTYTDDRNLNVYHLHKIWIDYISGVYRGEFTPKKKYIKERILDYATCAYYIVTAEDGETIIFWSKYYGVFPTTIPSTPYTWSKGTTISQPDITIDYQYSFKEDYNPMALLEFNLNSNITGNTTAVEYVPTYDAKLGHSGSMWVGPPFVELYQNDDTGEYQFKLRFKPA